MRIKNKILDIVLSKLRLIWHLLYWCAAFLVLLRLYSPIEPAKIDYIYTTIFLIPIIISTYINLYLFIPRLLKKERYLFYILFATLLALFCGYSIFKLFDSWIDHILKDYFFVSYQETGILFLVSGIFIALSTLLKVAREWSVMLRKEKEENLVRLKNLQAQVNPHFLLNSLQTIYSQSLDRSVKTPDTVLQLSEILKYSLYETEHDKVLLSREIEIIESYLNMIRHRVDNKRVKIDFELLDDCEDLKIIPMLFLPFIENSVKHGLQGTEKKAFISLKLKCEGTKVYFNIRNNKGKSALNQELNQGGIGIENTRKRLQLAYPNKHKLDILDREHSFEIQLVIDLSKG